MKCVYCGNELVEENRSLEHVIPQAIGGLLETYNICCINCNTTQGDDIDSEFVKIFNPIIESFDLKTSRVKKSKSYTGIVSTIKNNNKIEYKANFRGRNINVLFDINDSKFIKQVGETEQNEYKIEQLDFIFTEEVFINGIIKIGFNYAIYNGISAESLNYVYDTIHRKLISSRQAVVPFVPLNKFDENIEKRELNRLSHSIKIFSVKSYLFAYIELFSTFQYYVILSNQYKISPINDSYCQMLEKRDFEPNVVRESLKCRRIDDPMILANQYAIPLNVENESYEGMVQRVEKIAFERIRLEEYVVDLHEEVFLQYSRCALIKSMNAVKDINEFVKFQAYLYYLYSETEYEDPIIEEHNGEIVYIEGKEKSFNETIDKYKYRILCYIEPESHSELYPVMIIREIMRLDFDSVTSSYKTQKMQLLSNYLLDLRNNKYIS